MKVRNQTPKYDLSGARRGKGPSVRYLEQLQMVLPNLVSKLYT